MQPSSSSSKDQKTLPFFLSFFSLGTNGGMTKVTAWKPCDYEVFSDPYFSVFRRNVEIYRLNLQIQSKYGKMQ